MMAEQLWVIAYDSPSDKRRRKLAKLLEGYGERLQWSVFECRLQPHQLQQLRDRKSTRLNSSHSSVSRMPSSA